MAEQNTQRPSGREPQKVFSAMKTSKKEQGTQEKKSLVRVQRKIMAAAPKSHLPVKRLAVEGFRTGQHNTMWHPEIQPYATPKQDSSYGQLLPHCTPVFAPMPCTSATLSPQLTVTFSWEPSQPIAVPCLYPNILQSHANAITPLLQPQVLVPNVSTEVPHIRTQVSDACTQVPEISTEDPNISNQVSSSDELVRQKELDAVDALLTLHTFSQI